MDKTLSLDLQQTDFGRGLDKEIKRLDGRIDDETEARSAADQEIWTEIEAIEAASDVVDVVGTYAELEAYDTSALKNNDIIKVLADETHDDAIAYYRWNTSTEAFTFVGVEGPYYTASETDTLLADKQDKLVAGSNIQIAADGKTISATDTTYTAGTNIQIDDNVISATDTTYSAFTGATGSVAGASGLVPAPTAGDDAKYLKGDGTWATVSTGTTETRFYLSGNSPVFSTAIYKDANRTVLATYSDLETAYANGVVTFVARGDKTYDCPHSIIFDSDGVTFWNAKIIFWKGAYGSLSRVEYISVDQNGSISKGYKSIQQKLIAGTNIAIDPDTNTISATDTTYSAFGGATSSAAGTAGLVPAPVAGDETKFLAGDGTWQTVSGGGGGGSYSAGYGINIDANNEISADQTVLALRTDLVGKQDVLTAGSNITISNNTISATDTTYSAMTGATSSAAGTSGLVPAPAAGDDTKFLRGDGTWGTVTTNALLIKEWS